MLHNILIVFWYICGIRNTNHIAETFLKLDFVLHQVIKQHGGAVIPNYSSDCTHVLCVHQHGNYFRQVRGFVIFATRPPVGPP